MRRFDDDDADAEHEDEEDRLDPAGVKADVAVPRSMVGRVIGRGGDTVKLLQRAYGVNIQIDQVRKLVGGTQGWWGGKKKRPLHTKKRPVSPLHPPPSPPTP